MKQTKVLFIHPKKYKDKNAPSTFLFPLYYHLIPKLYEEGILEKLYEIDSSVTHPFIIEK